MTYETEREFEKVVIAQLIEGGWKAEVIRYPTEEELIQNWANILFENNRGRDQLNGCPLTKSEMDQTIEAAMIQGFSWQKDRYSEVLEDGIENFITMDFDEPTLMVTLVMRSSRLSV